MKQQALEQDSSNNTEAAQSSAAFITDYLPLACFLAARKHLASLQATGSGTILFLFAPSLQLTQDLADFNEGDARIEPACYDAARIRLRRRMGALNGGGR